MAERDCRGVTARIDRTNHVPAPINVTTPPALLQFWLSNPLLDVALVGMRTDTDVTASCATWRDTQGRIDVDALWTRYV